ncbi:MAG: hypothetical protein ACREVE_07380 [Gammaproteobacteria bacterium]
MKRKHLNVLVGLVLTAVALPNGSRADDGFQVGTEIDSIRLSDLKLDSWQEYAIYLVSQQMCRAPSDSEEKVAPEERICMSLIAEMAAEAGISDPQGHVLSALENVDWNGAMPFDGGGLDVESTYVVTKSDVSNLYNSENELATIGNGRIADDDLRLRDLPMGRGVDNAIPGSLLVTILALVGIVAVARRDVPGKPNPRSFAGSRPGVARISSSQEDVNIVR